MKDVTQIVTMPDGRYEKEYSDGAIETGSLAFIRDSDKAVVDKFGSPVSGGGVAATAVTAAGVLADTAPASPGEWPALTSYYISTAGAGVDVGTQVVWIPPAHATLPAAKGWRFAFYPSATVV